MNNFNFLNFTANLCYLNKLKQKKKSECMCLKAWIMENIFTALKIYFYQTIHLEKIYK